MNSRRRLHFSLQRRGARFVLTVAIVAAVLVLALVGSASGQSVSPASPVPSPTASPPAACRKDPLAGVYHPWRLRINQPCITVSGIVERVRTEPDHDWHINLKLPAASQDLINGKNREYEHGDLVVEVIPMDQPHIRRPSVGERIRVTGAYVLDADHGWEEIHPAWLIDGQGTTSYSSQAALNSVRIGIAGNRRYFGHRRSR